MSINFLYNSLLVKGSARNKAILEIWEGVKTGSGEKTQQKILEIETKELLFLVEALKEPPISSLLIKLIGGGFA